MDQQPGLDRNALIGIVLMSLVLGLWMVFTAPSPEEIEAQQQAQEAQQAEQLIADSLDAIAQGPTTLDAPGADSSSVSAPIDSSFAAALSGPQRTLTVVSNRYEATFSTKGGSPVSYRLLNYNRAESDEPVELVSNEEGALSIQFLPPRGAALDSRALTFRPVVDGAVFEGDTLRIAEGSTGTLSFEAPIADGALRLVYGFEHDSYDVDFRVETPGSNLLQQSGGYDVIWNGAVPLSEAQPDQEIVQAGAYALYGGDTEFIRLDEPGEAEPIQGTGDVGWVAVKTKFFLAAIIPTEGTQTEGFLLEGSQIGEVDSPDSFAQDYTARIEMPRLEVDGSAAFTLYLGPLELRRLAEYGLYDTVDFGFGAFMTRPIARYIIAPSLAFLHGFIPSYGWAIVLFALLVKLVLWPLTAVSYRSQARMKELQPQMAAIKEKYGDDPQKQQEATMKMYREAGVNPLGGCLPMLLQYPILIAMWRFFQSTLVLRGESFLWAADLSAPDPVLQLPFTIPFVGDFLAGFTILMAATMVISMRLSGAGGAAAGTQQKVIMYMMPLIFFLFFNRFPSGLSLYYLAFNVFSIVQQRLVNQQVAAASASGEKGNGGPGGDGQAGRPPKGPKGGGPKGKGKTRSNGRSSKRKGGILSQAIADAKKRR